MENNSRGPGRPKGAKNKAKNIQLSEPGTINPNSGAEVPASTPFPSAAGAGVAGPNGATIAAGNRPVTIGAPSESESSAFQTGAKMQTEARGNTGTQIFGGYFSEEYLAELRGRRGAKQWDEMRRSEAQIAMLLNAIMNPIKAANWDFDAYDESNPDTVKHKDLVQMCIKEMIDFDTFKTEALTVIPFGFAIMEVVHSVEFNHPKLGTFNGLKALSFRSQKTIENWALEPKTGRLLGVNQYTYSDLGGNEFLPGEFLLVFTHMKEGDNYEGISALRPMLGAYKRKDLYLKLAAIGVERYAVGTPVGTIPKGKEKSKEVAAFQQALQNFTSHEASYLMLPEGWKVEIIKQEFDASKIKELLTFENTEFANAVVGNFLALGMNGGGGAYALGSNLGEFFTSGIQAYADLICSAVNRDLIPNLVKLNYGDQPGYPKMKCTGISDKAGKELAETIKYLADSRTLDPDKPLKEHLRKLYKLPKPDVDTATAMPAIPAGGSANYPKPNDPVIDPKTGKLVPFNPNQLDQNPANDTAKFAEMKLAESKYIQRFDKNKAALKALMQEQLEILYAGLKEMLRKKYNAASGSDKILAAKGLETPGLNAYKAALREQLSKIADQTIAESRKLVPSKKSVKLAGYDALPPVIRKLIDAQSSAIAETQAGDIEKQVFFNFTTNAASSDDIDNILHEVDGAVEPMIKGSTSGGMNVDAAAGDAAAYVTNNASNAFFLDSEVVEEIESFTFTNEDPVSEICQAMVGTTVAPTDPLLSQYTCPLHHNCKSRWVPNMVRAKGNPEIGSGDAQENGGLSLSKKALASMTLSEGKQNGRR